MDVPYKTASGIILEEAFRLRPKPDSQDGPTVMGAQPLQGLSVDQLKQYSKGELAREVLRMRGAMEQQDQDVAVEIAAAWASNRQLPAFRHKEAFMLMTYVSDGGHFTLRVWNSRDGVTPSRIHIDKLEYSHQVDQMAGPHFDRPDEAEAQWETRTQAATLAAWDRVLDRAVLLNRLSAEKATSARGNLGVAQNFNVHIGMRSMSTGKFTDDA